jgi:signal transduction histidine kinase
MLTYASLSHLAWLDIPVWVFNNKVFRIRWANAAAIRYWGADNLMALLERDFSDATEAAKTRLHNVLAATLRGQNPTEVWTLYPKGMPTPVRLQCNCIEAPDGEHEIIFAANNIVANGIQADNSLRRGIEAMRHTKVKIALYAFDGQAIMRNPAAEKDFPGQEFGRLFGDQGMTSKIMKKVRQQKAFAGQVILMTKGGPKWHDVDVRPIPDPVTGELVIQINAHDITHQKIVEAERDNLIQAQLNAERESLASARSEAQDAMRKATEAKRVFVAAASHELRTPLQAIQSTTDLMIIEAKGRKRLTSLLMNLRESARMLEGIAEDLGEFVRADHGYVSVFETNVEIETLSRLIIENYAAKARQKGLAFDSTIDCTVKTVFLDEVKLKQVVTNLLNNSLKYTLSGSISLAITCQALSKEQAALVVTVRDTGIGMKEAEIPSLMQPFVRGHSSEGIDRKGLGLGLAIVKSYVEAMHGQLSFKSEQHVGTEVRVALRLACGEPGSRQPVDHAGSSELNVLVVDDDDQTRTILGELISQFPLVKCRLASSGSEGLDIMAGQAIDVALVDVQMPGMTGFEVSRQAKSMSLNKAVRVIGMSAYEVEGGAFDNFLPKPISVQKLAAALGVSASAFEL